MLEEREGLEVVLRFLEEEVGKVKERISALDGERDGVLDYVRGVGSKTCEALQSIGVKTARDLAESSPYILAGLAGLTVKRAERLIEDAKTFLAERDGDTKNEGHPAHKGNTPSKGVAWKKSAQGRPPSPPILATPPKYTLQPSLPPDRVENAAAFPAKRG